MAFHEPRPGDSPLPREVSPEREVDTEWALRLIEEKYPGIKVIPALGNDPGGPGRGKALLFFELKRGIDPVAIIRVPHPRIPGEAVEVTREGLEGEINTHGTSSEVAE